MTFTARELPRAKGDKRHIVQWLLQRSPQGAAAWLNAYDQMIERLKAAGDSFPLAEESKNLDFEMRQILFKTRRGRIYRAVFHIQGADLFVLRVRGPGQAPIDLDDVTT